MKVNSVRDLGALVSERREALGMTQSALALDAGVSREWVVAFERGAGSPTLHRVLRVMRSLGVSLDARAEEETHA